MFTPKRKSLLNVEAFDLFGWLECFKNVEIEDTIKEEIASYLPSIIETMLTGQSKEWRAWLNGEMLDEEAIQQAFPIYEWLNEDEKRELSHWLDVDYRAYSSELLDYYEEEERQLQLYYEAGYDFPICWAHPSH